MPNSILIHLPSNIHVFADKALFFADVARGKKPIVIGNDCLKALTRIFLRIVSGLLAFTLFLPVTLTGLALKTCSSKKPSATQDKIQKASYLPKKEAIQKKIESVEPTARIPFMPIERPYIKRKTISSRPPIDISNDIAKPKKLSGIKQYVEGCSKHIFIDGLQKSLFQDLCKEINQKHRGRLYFPSLEEMEKMPIETLQEIWRNNNLSLIGMIDQADIPSLGFHGTGKAGLEGIIRTKTTHRKQKDSIFVASLGSNTCNPVTFLADLYTIIQRASDYAQINLSNSEPGGIILIDMSKEIPKGLSPLSFYTCFCCDVRKNLNYDHNLRCFSSIRNDAESDGKFLSLIHRTICDPMALDYQTSFTPETYNQRVKGVIAHTQYPIEKWQNIHGEKRSLLRRIYIQEHIVQVLAKFPLITKLPRDIFAIGLKHMTSIDASTHLTANDWLMLRGIEPESEPCIEEDFTMPPPMDD